MSAGEAEAIYRRADATAKGINLVSQAVTAHGGSEAASLRVAEQVCIPFWNAPTGKKLCWCPCRPAGMAECLLLQNSMGKVAEILGLGGQYIHQQGTGKHASMIVQASPDHP